MIFFQEEVGELDQIDTFHVQREKVSGSNALARITSMSAPNMQATLEDYGSSEEQSSSVRSAPCLVKRSRWSVYKYMYLYN